MPDTPDRAARLAYNHAYYRANRERLLAWHKAYRLAHLDEKRAKDRAYNVANRVKLSQKRAEKWAANREQNRAELKHRLKARLDALAGRPKPDRSELCSRSGAIVFDHCHQKGHFRAWL